MELLSDHGCFGGQQRFYQHDAKEIGLPMRFSVYLPPQAFHGPVPAVVYLAGRTCNEETFMVNAGAQRVAAELGLALIAPDTSPRGAGAAGARSGDPPAAAAAAGGVVGAAAAAFLAGTMPRVREMCAAAGGL